MLTDYFSVPLFFVLLRETLEIGIILSVLLAFIDRLALKDKPLVQNMKTMVWSGTLIAVFIVLTIGGIIIFFWYTVGVNLFEGSELIYEATFGIIASIFLTITVIVIH
jgi:high-affinity iron transporter